MAIGEKVEAEAADYMITGSITSLGFEQSSTGLGGLSFLKGPLSMLAGAVDYKKSKVHMNMDIRVVDVKRAKIIASKTFQANNENTGFDVSAMGWGGGTGLGGNHASISGSPLEEVARPAGQIEVVPDRDHRREKHQRTHRGQGDRRLGQTSVTSSFGR